MWRQVNNQPMGLADLSYLLTTNNLKSTSPTTLIWSLDHEVEQAWAPDFRALQIRRPPLPKASDSRLTTSITCQKIFDSIGSRQFSEHFADSAFAERFDFEQARTFPNCKGERFDTVRIRIYYSQEEEVLPFSRLDWIPYTWSEEGEERQAEGWCMSYQSQGYAPI